MIKYVSIKTLFFAVLICLAVSCAYSTDIKTLTLSTAPEEHKDAIASSPDKAPADEQVAHDAQQPLDPVKTTAACRRKRQSLYKKKKVYMRDMTYEELRDTKDQRLAEKNIEAAIKYAEKMLPLCKDMHEQRDLMLELADLLFDNAELEKAGKMYQEFVKLYPGTETIEHASYRAILCSFYGILDSERDQTKTKETVELTTAFLERSEIFTERHDEVLTIQKKCYERLVESELNVLNYYLNNDRFTAAQTRVDGLRKEYVAKMVDLEPRLLSTEIIIAEKQGKTEVAAEKRLILAKDYPHFNQEVVVIAQNADKRFADKF